MGELRDEVKKYKDTQSKTRKYPVIDGRYRLPDRRILIKQGEKFILIGHREKKKSRALGRITEEGLRTLLVWPGFGSNSPKSLNDKTKAELVRLLEPRPRQVFHVSWLKTSGCEAARELRPLVRRATLE